MSHYKPCLPYNLKVCGPSSVYMNKGISIRRNLNSSQMKDNLVIVPDGMEL